MIIVISHRMPDERSSAVKFAARQDNHVRVFHEGTRMITTYTRVFVSVRKKPRGKR
jgi:hypothetical protein